jgi:hypothetical protein
MMRKQILTIALILAGSISASAWSAGLPDDVKYKISTFSMQLTACYAYYSILAHCAEVSDAPEVAKKSQAAAQTLLPLIYQTGKIAGLLNSALLGRI